jgi:prophage regulatory protein
MTKSVRILRIGDVIQKTALSRSQIYRLIALNAFPSQIRLGVRAAGWIENEVEHWLLDRIIETRGTPAPGSAPP